MINSAKYTERGSILSVIDEVEMTVHDDMENRHRILIAEWEAKGNQIEPYAPPAPDFPAYAAQKRWEKEVGGILVNGLTVSTDDRSKTMISGARVAAQNDPTFSTQWKSSDGTFATINAAAVIAISDAMLSHVSDCFAIEAKVLAEIDAGTISSIEQIDAAFA